MKVGQLVRYRAGAGRSEATLSLTGRVIKTDRYVHAVKVAWSDGYTIWTSTTALEVINEPTPRNEP